MTIVRVGRWVAAVLALAACSGSDSTEADANTGSYVGTVDASAAYVAVVVEPDGATLAYVSDGDESVDWLDGRVADDAASLRNDGGAVLDVTFTDDGATGSFTRPGVAPLTFTVEPADAPAGLYRAEKVLADGLYVGGWVVLADGTQKGAVRRFETPLPPGSVDPVLDLDDPTIVVPGGTLTATPVAPRH